MTVHYGQQILKIKNSQTTEIQSKQENFCQAKTLNSFFQGKRLTENFNNQSWESWNGDSYSDAVQVYGISYSCRNSLSIITGQQIIVFSFKQAGNARYV